MKYYDAWELDKVESLLETSPLDLEEKKEIVNLLSIREKQKKELLELEKFSKEVIYEGEIVKLEKYITKDFVNKFKLSSLKELETKGARAYFGKRVFYKNTLEMLMVINYYEENLYVELELKYENERWQIESFSERR